MTYHSVPERVSPENLCVSLPDRISAIQSFVYAVVVADASLKLPPLSVAASTDAKRT